MKKMIHLLIIMLYELFELINISFLVGVFFGAVGLIAYFSLSEPCQKPEDKLSQWSRLNQKIYPKLDATVAQIVQDIESEFTKQYPNIQSIMNGIVYKGHDYPTLTVKMERPMAEVDDVVTIINLSNGQLNNALSRALCYDQPENAELIYVRFTDETCPDCGFVCSYACKGVGQYDCYWVDYQFPHFV